MRLGGIDADRLGRRGHGDEARPDPKGRPGGEPGRARPGRAARSHEGVAAVVFVGGAARASAAARAPERRRVGEEARAACGEDVRANSDIGDLDRRRNRPGPASADGTACGPRRSRSATPSTTAPRTCPVSPSRPDGRSTARIGLARTIHPLDGQRAPRLRGPATSPVPNRASMMRSASWNAAASGPGSPSVSSPGPPRPRRPSACRGLPRSARDTAIAPLREQRGGHEAVASILPRSATTTTIRAPFGAIRSAASATACPARRISSIPGVPDRIAGPRRVFISAGVRTSSGGS